MNKSYLLGLTILVLGLAVIHNISKTYENAMHIIELQREDIEIKQEIIELMEKDRTAEEQARLEELKHE